MWSYGKDPIPPDPSKKSMHTSCCLFTATYVVSGSDTNPGITQNKGRPRGAAGNPEPCSSTNCWRVKQLHFGDVTETVPGEVLLVLPRVRPQPPLPLKKCLQSVNRKGQDSALERERQKLRDEFAWLHVRLASQKGFQKGALSPRPWRISCSIPPGWHWKLFSWIQAGVLKSR